METDRQTEKQTDRVTDRLTYRRNRWKVNRMQSMRREKEKWRITMCKIGFKNIIISCNGLLNGPNNKFCHTDIWFEDSNCFPVANVNAAILRCAAIPCSSIKTLRLKFTLLYKSQTNLKTIWAYTRHNLNNMQGDVGVCVYVHHQISPGN